MKKTLSHLAAFVLGVLVGGLLVTHACPPTPAPASQPLVPKVEKIETSKEVEKKDGEITKSKEETKTSVEVAPKVSAVEAVK